MYWLKDWKECPRIPVIYMLYCVANDRFYIGSTISMRDRMYGHQIKLLHGSSKQYISSHANQHLQNIYNKYGLESIQVHILEQPTPDNLLKYEQNWIDSYYESDRCVNISRLVGAGWNGETRAVSQYSKETGEFIREWPYVAVAARAFKSCGTTIYKNCNREMKSSNGFIWRYSDESIYKIPTVELDIHRGRRRPLKVYDLNNGELIIEYSSKKQALKCGHSRASHVISTRPVLYTKNGVLSIVELTPDEVLEFYDEHKRTVSLTRSRAGKLGGVARHKQSRGRSPG